jgi:hypothetical protein
MKINGRITILVDRDGTTIEVDDENSSLTFLRIKLTPKQFQAALSKLAYTPCEETEVFNLNKIGKKMMMKEWKFKVPLYMEKLPGEEMKEKLKQYVVKYCPEDCEPDLYFNSQDSFFYIGEDLYARTTIRRWE